MATETGNSDKRSRISRNAILDAAEALFGRFGPEGVSLRQISAAAGSANNSAVQYHFKNKEGLIDGIFNRRLLSLEMRRAKLLEHIVQQNSEIDTRALIEALLLPIAEEKDSSGYCSFAAFLLGLRMFGDFSRWARYSDSAPVTLKINSLLRNSLESLSEDDFAARRIAAVSVFLISVVDWDRRKQITAVDEPPNREQYLHQILDFAAAGMMAG